MWPRRVVHRRRSGSSSGGGARRRNGRAVVRGAAVGRPGGQRSRAADRQGDVLAGLVRRRAARLWDPATGQRSTRPSPATTSSAPERSSWPTGGCSSPADRSTTSTRSARRTRASTTRSRTPGPRCPRWPRPLVSDDDGAGERRRAGGVGREPPRPPQPAAPGVADGAGSYRNLTAAEKWLPLYPWMYLAPNGKVFNAGPNGWTSYLDPSGTGTWDQPLGADELRRPGHRRGHLRLVGHVRRRQDPHHGRE